MYGPQVLQSEGFKSIAKEIFGGIGYKDAERFLDFAPGGQDPKDAQMQQMMQQAQQAFGQLQAQNQQLAQQVNDKNADRQLQAWVTQFKGNLELMKQERDFVGKKTLAEIDAQSKRRDTYDEQLLEILRGTTAPPRIPPQVTPLV